MVSAHGRQYGIEIEKGEILWCVRRGKQSGAACGDHVELARTSRDQGVIEQILPRTSLLYRSDPFRQKIIAANVTQAIIVLAPVPSYSDELLSRCLLAVEHERIKALILLNKTDLTEEARKASEALQPYRDLGYEVLAISAKQDVNLLRAHLRGHWNVLVGQSGMGKSTIVNALIPSALAATGDISEALDSGRHTTTHARLYHIDDESHIIDSPGMQEFGLHHLTREDLAWGFSEIRPLLGQCRFSNCRHLDEPGCAVTRAVEEGKITERRYAYYRRLAEKTLQR